MLTRCKTCFGCCNALFALEPEWEKKLFFKHLYIKVDVSVEGIIEPYTVCPFFFIGEKNYCLIYEHRPKICRETPCEGFMKFPPTH